MVNESSSAPSPSAPLVQRVLIVEDLEDTRTSLQELLQMSLKLEVDTAEDGATAAPFASAAEALQSGHHRSRMPKLSGMKTSRSHPKRADSLRNRDRHHRARERQGRGRSHADGARTTSSQSRRTRNTFFYWFSARYAACLQDEVTALRSNSATSTRSRTC